MTAQDRPRARVRTERSRRRRPSSRLLGFRGSCVPAHRVARPGRTQLEKRITCSGAFANAFRTPDLRRKLLFSLLIIAIFRLGSQIPTPGVNVANVQACIDDVENNGLYGLINLFSGGALLQLSIFALGIMPYITASIILQLLVVVIPRLEALKKEGQAGQTKITQYTRYLTLGLAILQADRHRRAGPLAAACSRAAPSTLLYNDSTLDRR